MQTNHTISGKLRFIKALPLFIKNFTKNTLSTRAGKNLIISLLLSLLLIFPACDILKELEIPFNEPLTEQDIITGLKEALRVGTENGVSSLSQVDAYYANPLYKIPFPEDVKYVEEKLRALGFNKMLDDFIINMNRGAEKAVKKASPIFLKAIKSMSFSDAKKILAGSENEATNYFHSKTYDQLKKAFKPDVQNTLDQIQLTAYWDDITTAYNKIPFTKKVETDLAEYVTTKTVDGLFIKISQEEKLIREDPRARVNEILRKVFGQN